MQNMAQDGSHEVAWKGQAFPYLPQHLSAKGGAWLQPHDLPPRPAAPPTPPSPCAHTGHGGYGTVQPEHHAAAAPEHPQRSTVSALLLATQPLPAAPPPPPAWPLAAVQCSSWVCRECRRGGRAIGCRGAAAAPHRAPGFFSRPPHRARRRARARGMAPPRAATRSRQPRPCRPPALPPCTSRSTCGSATALPCPSWALARSSSWRQASSGAHACSRICAGRGASAVPAPAHAAPSRRQPRRLCITPRLLRRRALDTGYRHLDCAALYCNEQMVGKELKEWVGAGNRREDVFVTSKARGRVRTLARVLRHCPVATTGPGGCEAAAGGRCCTRLHRAQGRVPAPSLAALTPRAARWLPRRCSTTPTAPSCCASRARRRWRTWAASTWICTSL